MKERDKLLKYTYIKILRISEPFEVIPHTIFKLLPLALTVYLLDKLELDIIWVFTIGFIFNDFHKFHIKRLKEWNK